MPQLQVITASTRDGRKGPLVVSWFLEQARGHGGFAVEAVDLAEVDLPLFDEPRHPRLAQYEHEHTKRWSATVSRADAFVFVTPEYDYGAPASLVNALQFLVREWAYKPVGFCSYGGVSGGTRGVQMTKQIVTTLKMMPMAEGVAVPMVASHIGDDGAFASNELIDASAKTMLDELLRWAEALKAMRA